MSLSGSLQAWRQGEIASTIRFGDAKTLSAVHDLWSKYSDALQVEHVQQRRSGFQSSLQRTEKLSDGVVGDPGAKHRLARAAAPLGMQTLGDAELMAARRPWETDGAGHVPNPLFAVPLESSPFDGPNTLSKICDPILGFHLATAKSHLANESPLKQSGPGHSHAADLAAAAQLQFSEWVDALLDVSERHGNLTVRFISADSIAFCHTLQHLIETGETCANLYRRRLSADRLMLDPEEYAKDGVPRQFSSIETSDLADSAGTLNVLAAASPLLKNTPWATLFTETTSQGTGGRTGTAEELLCGPLVTVSTLLGISPFQYWTNATAVSTVDEYMAAASNSQTSSQISGIRSRLSWKENRHLSNQPTKASLRVNTGALAALLRVVYQNMLGAKSMGSPTNERQLAAERRTVLSKHTRGTFVAFVRLLLQTVESDTRAVAEQVLSGIDSQLSLEMSRQGLYSQSNPEAEESGRMGKNTLSTRSDNPDVVYITIKIPRDQWEPVYQASISFSTPFMIQAHISGPKNDQPLLPDLIDDVQILFGTLEGSGERGGSDFSVAVKQDKSVRIEDSNLLASFCVSAATAQRDVHETNISLLLQNNFESQRAFGKLAGMESLEIFNTSLDDADNVYITRYPPGQCGYPVYSSLVLRASHRSDISDCASHFSCDIDSSGQITSITGHLDVRSDDGKKLLADKAPVEVRKAAPCVFHVILGNRDATFTLNFPVPVAKNGSKTRVARTSAYIEIVTTLADPAMSEQLNDFIFPAILADCSAPGLPTPVTLNIPHLTLDTLPILDTSDKPRLGFLTTLTSWMFSARERKLREQSLESNSAGLAPSARLNFKESLFTMFMLASGLQGGQTGLFAIHHPDRGGIHMLLFVSAIRLDPANASVVLDAAVIPFTTELVQSGVLDSFLLVLRTLECCTLTVDDDELILWKNALPALAERCRDWAHAAGPGGCEFARRGTTGVPLSTEPGGPVLCGCGAGKLPRDFVGLPEWEEAAARFATRIAVSPVYASPLVEEVVDPGVLRSAVAGAAPGAWEALRCRACGAAEARGGAGGALKKCMRCLRVRYCSAECQKKDWKKHRMECEGAGEWQT